MENLGGEQGGDGCPEASVRLGGRFANRLREGRGKKGCGRGESAPQKPTRKHRRRWNKRKCVRPPRPRKYEKKSSVGERCPGVKKLGKEPARKPADVEAPMRKARLKRSNEGKNRIQKERPIGFKRRVQYGALILMS